MASSLRHAVAHEDDVVALDDPRAMDPARFGGKAAGLARLAVRGVPVPPGVAIAADALADAVVAGAVEVDVLRGRAGRPGAALRAAAAFLDELGPVAVRSSAMQEDGAAKAAAGQYETVLGVIGPEQLCDAVAVVLRSQLTDHVRAYWDADVTTNTVAVVVQRLVSPQRAGVLFTRNPVNGRPDFVIEACRGLGVSVVDGDGVLERVTIDPSNLAVLSRTVRDRGTERHWNPDLAQVVSSDVSNAGGAPILTDGDLAALVEFGTYIERELSTPADIEWAIDEAGLWIVQARPITTLERA